jgi:protein transport protein SEC24
MQGMPAGFDSGNSLSSMGQYPPGGMAPGGQGVAPSADPSAAGNPAGVGSSGGAPLPLIDEMDLSIQCNPAFLRPSVSKIVNSQALATASRVPLGLVCKPMSGDKGVINDEIEVVDFGSTGIIRCKRCRTYINPFVTWADNGRRWRYISNCFVALFIYTFPLDVIFAEC